MITEPTPNTYTPDTNPEAALHWAAAALNLAERRTAQNILLTSTENATYERYQTAARSHGFTDDQIREYAARMSRLGE